VNVHAAGKFAYRGVSTHVQPEVVDGTSGSLLATPFSSRLHYAAVLSPYRVSTLVGLQLHLGLPLGVFDSL